MQAAEVSEEVERVARLIKRDLLDLVRGILAMSYVHSRIELCIFVFLMSSGVDRTIG
jgi:hypothetical protein